MNFCSICNTYHELGQCPNIWKNSSTTSFGWCSICNAYHALGHCIRNTVPIVATGWICPVCHRGVSPNMSSCPCVYTQTSFGSL